ncbi:N2227-like protein-domain-containing protein [Diplogelasinospora grovesii]|uniref:carnosine N-methyltransferase n=1 Tax=Diplogelasinospora grovesii TaxID=303347 RepID=A0AAN6S3X5_9PEZI|nr:N2227-like protein-domain-containing protein [Diplogelasinospora grovesii]
MADKELDDESHWEVDGIEDPEEIRVIFCAIDSYIQYAKTAHFTTHSRRQAFYALPQAHWKLLAAPPFNYLQTLDKVDEAIDANAELSRAIVQTGLQNFVSSGAPGQELTIPPEWAGCAKYPDVDKARSTLRQFYRDWSAGGAAEREASYGPVMRALAEEKAAKGDGYGPLKVLVPGAGLGRLVFDLCLNGYDTEGNEISYHQLLASAYVLNSCDRPGKHTIYPWIHTFSNHQTRANHLRGYAVPDVHCHSELTRVEQEGRKKGTMTMCASDFLCLYNSDGYADMYDAVASVFFLDTAPNLLRYLQTIFHCLKPGGVLINVGPLLWHFENNAPGSHSGHDDDGADDREDGEGTTGIADPGSYELTDDEVMALVKHVGFEIVWHETGIECPYIQDPDSMLQTVYQASAWLARKPTGGA